MAGKDLPKTGIDKKDMTDAQLYSLEQLKATGRGDDKFVREMPQLVIGQIPAAWMK